MNYLYLRRCERQLWQLTTMHRLSRPGEGGDALKRRLEQHRTYVQILRKTMGEPL